MKIPVFYDRLIEAKEQCGKTMDEILKIVYEEGISAIEINLIVFLENEEEIKMLLNEYKLYL